MRVLRVIARMNVGGPARQVVALHHPTTGLGTLGFEQRLLVGSVDRDEADELALRDPGIGAIRVPGLGRAPAPGADLLALGRIVAEIRRFRPHIVHTHTAKAGVLGRLAAGMSGMRPATVHTFHGHLLHGYFRPSVRAAVVEVERRLARRTTSLVAVGAKVRDDLLAAGVGRPDQYTVVPPGVDLPQPPSRQEARRRLEVGPNAGLVVGFAGRLTAVKRPDRFLDAIAELCRRGIPATGLLAGSGELEGDLRRQAEQLGIAPQIRFLGVRSDIEVVWAACDVAVATSDNEGMPMALIEAALVGRPAVTTDVGSASEVVIDGRTGLVVASDPAALASALERLAGDPDLRKRLGTHARQRATEEFAAERLVAACQALYLSLAGRG